MPPLIVIPRPDPLTVLIPAWCVFWGLFGTVSYVIQPPPSTGGISPAGVYLFFGGLIACGSAILYGMWLHTVRGAQIQRGANVALGLLCLIYSGWSVQALGFRATVLVSWLLTVAAASFWNAVRLNRALDPKEGR